MAPESFAKQCERCAIRNIRKLDEDSLGITPWRLLQPILMRCEDPKMLRKWEQNTPQIRGETGEIWLKFIKRDIPNWRNKPHEPSNPESWWKVYKKLKNEADEEERRAEQMLKDKMSKIKKDESEWKVAPPTKAIPERKGRNKGTAMQFQRGSDNNGLRFTTGTKTKDFMQSVRRQAAESSLQKKGVLARPTSMLNNGVAAKKIMHAPQHMVEDCQRLAEQSRPRVPHASQSKKLEMEKEGPRMSLAARAAHDLKMREERLRAVREGRAVPASSPTSSPAKAAPAPVRQGFVGMNASAASRPISQASKQDNSPAKKPSTATHSKLTAGGGVFPDAPSNVDHHAAPGMKRKAGPTILRDVKRTKR